MLSELSSRTSTRAERCPLPSHRHAPAAGSTTHTSTPWRTVLEFPHQRTPSSLSPPAVIIAGATISPSPLPPSSPRSTTVKSSAHTRLPWPCYHLHFAVTHHLELHPTSSPHAPLPNHLLPAHHPLFVCIAHPNRSRHPPSWPESPPQDVTSKPIILYLHKIHVHDQAVVSPFHPSIFLQRSEPELLTLTAMSAARRAPRRHALSTVMRLPRPVRHACFNPCSPSCSRQPLCTAGTPRHQVPHLADRRPHLPYCLPYQRTAQCPPLNPCCDRRRRSTLCLHSDTTLRRVAQPSPPFRARCCLALPARASFPPRAEIISVPTPIPHPSHNHPGSLTHTDITLPSPPIHIRGQPPFRCLVPHRNHHPCHTQFASATSTLTSTPTIRASLSILSIAPIPPLRYPLNYCVMILLG